MLASALAYSLFPVFSKGVLDELRPTDVLFWRFAIAAPLAWVVVWTRRARGGPGPSSAPAMRFTGAGLLFGLVALAAFAALDHLAASLYTVLIYTYPAMVALGAIALGRRPTPGLWWAVALSSLGIALTVPEVFDNPDADGLGLVLALLNAGLYAAYVLLTGRWMERPTTPANGAPTAAAADGLVASAWSMAGSLVLAVAVVAVAGLRMPGSAATAAGLVGLAVVSTTIAGTTLMLGLARLPAATAALVATIEPVLTLVWSVVLLDESLVVLQIVGAALVLAGVVQAQRTSPVTAVEPG